MPHLQIIAFTLVNLMKQNGFHLQILALTY